MQCACAILSSVVCPALQNFPTLYQIDNIFEKKKNVEYEMWVVIFSTNFVRKIFHYKKKSTRYCHKYT